VGTIRESDTNRTNVAYVLAHSSAIVAFHLYDPLMIIGNDRRRQRDYVAMLEAEEERLVAQQRDDSKDIVDDNDGATLVMEEDGAGEEWIDTSPHHDHNNDMINNGGIMDAATLAAAAADTIHVHDPRSANSRIRWQGMADRNDFPALSTKTSQTIKSSSTSASGNMKKPTKGRQSYSQRRRAAGLAGAAIPTAPTTV
jgi:hypothetical protein